jgi:SHS2 domain-containing protein
MSEGWQHFPHGADVGVRGIGRSLSDAFAEAARAMTAIAVDLDAVELRQSVKIACSGADVEDLLYAWLNAVIFEMAVRHMVFGRFEVEVDDGTVRAIAWGEPLVPERHQPSVEIKGATFTELSVRKEGDEWIAKCVVDGLDM